MKRILLKLSGEALAGEKKDSWFSHRREKDRIRRGDRQKGGTAGKGTGR